MAVRNDNSKPKPSNTRNKRRRDDEKTCQQEYYDRLLYQAQKSLHKAAKTTKGKLTQQLIRRLKKKQPNGNAKQQQKEEEEEDALLRFKSVNLDTIVQEGLRQLGMGSLNPSGGVVYGNGQLSERNTTEGQQRILLHKSFQSVLEQYHSEVTEYRRWCLRQEERQTAALTSTRNSKRTKSSKKNDQTNNNNNNEDGPFCTLNYYGPATTKDGGLPKKNRPGQRARRAKAQAIQAKVEGRRLESSLNWRPKKNHQSNDSTNMAHRDDSNHARSRAMNSRKNDNNNHGDDDDNDTPVHPSWQAAKQKTNISTFQGTKITFT